MARPFRRLLLHCMQVLLRSYVRGAPHVLLHVSRRGRRTLQDLRLLAERDWAVARSWLRCLGPRFAGKVPIIAQKYRHRKWRRGAIKQSRLKQRDPSQRLITEFFCTSTGSTPWSSTS